MINELTRFKLVSGNKNENYILRFILLMILLIMFIHVYSQKNKKEHMINITPINNPTWNRNKCKYMMNNVMEQVLEDYKINKSNTKNADLIFPCLYNETQKEISDMHLTSNGNEKVFILNNGDQLIAKNLLWKHITSHYGLDIASTMMPMTYILYEKSDLERFKKTYKPSNIYIMKKNVQQQQGLKITNDYNDIINGYKNNYMVAQKLLQDPYIIPDITSNGIIDRKINMRYYILVICKNNNIDVFVHNDGFMYYTAESFKKGSMDNNKNITTGYFKDRSVYSRLPLTRQQFWNYLDSSRNNLTLVESNIKQQKMKISNVVSVRINELLKNVFVTMIGNICSKNCNSKPIDKHISFQLFGADIALSDKLIPTIMEVNKGPDMTAKDERDKKLKYKVTSDIFRTIKIINDNGENGFEQILDYQNGILK